MTLVTSGPPARARGTSKLPKEQREQLILDAATDEFGAMGYAGASLGQIADRVGVSKALVLTYFGSKEALYTACADRAGANLIPRIEQVITTRHSIGDMAVATLDAIFTGLEQRPHDWNVLNDRTVPAGSSAAATTKQMRRTIAEQAGRGVQSLVRHSLDDPDDVSVLTDVWMGTVTAVVNWWLRHPDRTAAEMSARCGRILRAIAGAPP